SLFLIWATLYLRLSPIRSKAKSLRSNSQRSLTQNFLSRKRYIRLATDVSNEKYASISSRLSEPAWKLWKITSFQRNEESGSSSWFLALRARFASESRSEDLSMMWNVSLTQALISLFH